VTPKKAESMKLARHPIIPMLACLTFIMPLRAVADWQIVASNVVSGTAFPSTNLVVRKMAAHALREDTASTVSMLFLIQKQEQVVLNHLEKTYVRQRAAGAEQPLAGTLSSIRERSTFQGEPAEAWRWTNGPAWGCTWVGSSIPFFGSAPQPFINGKNPERPRTDVIPKLSVGSVFGTNIVVCTESHHAGPVAPSPAGTSVPAPAADSSYIMRSTLVSISQTNFSPSEFEIPSDYTDVTGQPPRSVQVRPEMLGSRMAGQGNMEGLRKQYDAGKPVLEVPKVRTAN
jgi:hypothetical protein